MIRVLFVCTGNICRSPTAEGVFRQLVAEHGLDGRIEADSAGMYAYHVGEPPDGRSRAAALRRGVDLSGQRARKVRREDFDDFDLILAMDRGHHAELLSMAPAEAEGKVAMFLEFAPHLGAADVPDPYYGGGAGFEQVLDLIEGAAAALLDHIKANRF
ncbi:MAG: low molecular weight protein-tyrosine-phosphatase [Alphaproteobacteria bacterium]